MKYRSHIQFHEYLLLFPQHQPGLGPKDFFFPPFSQWGVKVAGWGGMKFASGSPPPLPFFGSALVLKAYWAAGREYRRSCILICVVCHLFLYRTMDIFVIYNFFIFSIYAAYWIFSCLLLINTVVKYHFLMWLQSIFPNNFQRRNIFHCILTLINSLTNQSSFNHFTISDPLDGFR